MMQIQISAASKGFSYKRKVLEIKGKIHTNNPTTVIKATRKPKIARNPPVASLQKAYCKAQINLRIKKSIDIKKEGFIPIC